MPRAAGMTLVKEGTLGLGVYFLLKDIFTNISVLTRKKVSFIVKIRLLI